jgi:dynein heavy chain, axonemal
MLQPFDLSHKIPNLAAVMTALKRVASWDEAKKALGEADFMNKLMTFNKDTLDEAMIKKLSKFVNNKDFSPDAVGKVSGAARGLCLWVHAMKVRPLH